MAFTTAAMDVLEELSSDTSEELIQIRKPKKAKSNGEKGRPKKEKPAKKPKKEKREKKPKKEKREKAKSEKQPEQETVEEEMVEEETVEEENPEQETPEEDNPEQEKAERVEPETRRRSLRLLQRQLRKEDERRAARLIRRRKNSFASYFPKVLRNIHAGLSLSQRSVSILDSFVKDMFERIASEASFLARQNRSPTINSREIQTAVRLLLPGELCRRAVAEGTMAMVRYISSK
ncbi:histone H2B type 1-B-like [Apodemus sylvaticus]|uniref:histone H2B type 1-B-like n=1 Tax=Apodemus sylvaticus TaxID=10129 RepID=UPI002243C5C9|nr:histone H2B type 1-B-like [Apodemus sylvaticus]